MKAAVYDGAEGALTPEANERNEDKPAASYIWALVIGSTIDVVLTWGLMNYFLNWLRLLLCY